MKQAVIDKIYRHNTIRGTDLCSFILENLQFFSVNFSLFGSAIL